MAESSIEQVLKRAREQVIAEAREAVRTLADRAALQTQEEVLRAEARLTTLLNDFQQAGQGLAGFSLASAADLLLNGGWVKAERLDPQKLALSPIVNGFTKERHYQARDFLHALDQQGYWGEVTLGEDQVVKVYIVMLPAPRQG